MSFRTSLIRFFRGANGRVRATWRGLLPVTVGFGVQLVAFGLIAAALKATIDTDALGSGAAESLDVLLLGVASAVGLGVAVVLARSLDRRSLADYGIALSRRDLLDFAAGTVIGGLTYAVPTVVFLQVGSAALTDRFVSPVAGSGVTALLTGVAVVVFLAQVAFEEFAFRGAMLRNFAEGMAARGVGARRAVMIALATSSVCFGVMHVIRSGGGGVAGRSVELVVTSVLNGLLWGGAYVLTGRLSIATALHFGHNLWAAIIVQPSSIEMALPAVATITYKTSLLSLTVGKVLVGGVCLFAWLSLTRDTVVLNPHIARGPDDSIDHKGEKAQRATTTDD
ncbi:CPBP family intramembrane glutamic endopeptidase [Halobacterium yunchengense]|uniref:CPBP family intramembrane glutamic endopeptidase n=1 Tax=Halobacterium yunchengense TaxID=3108497 RepID=UPI0030090488